MPQPTTTHVLQVEEPATSRVLQVKELATAHALQAIAVGNDSWDNAHTSNPSSRGEGLGGNPSTLVQHAQCTNGSSDG
jgi:hypothetical protein